MLIAVARYIAIFMSIPICSMGVIHSVVSSDKVKQILVISQIILFSIQTLALAYCLIG